MTKRSIWLNISLSFSFVFSHLICAVCFRKYMDFSDSIALYYTERCKNGGWHGVFATISNVRRINQDIVGVNVCKQAGSRPTASSYTEFRLSTRVMHRLRMRPCLLHVCVDARSRVTSRVADSERRTRWSPHRSTYILARSFYPPLSSFSFLFIRLIINMINK